MHQHASSLAASAPGLSSSQIVSAVQECLNAGLLVSEEDYVAALRTSASDAVSPTITSVGLITHGNAGLLERALASYARLAADRRPLHVHDDSRHGVRPDAPPGAEVAHSARSNRRVFLAALRDRLSEDRLRAALFGLVGPPAWLSRPGANRNWLLVSTSGEVVHISDDDETTDYFGTANVAQGPLPVVTSSAYDPAAFRVVDTLRGAPVPGQEADRPFPDIVTLHERLVGKSVAGIVVEAHDSGALDLADTDRALAWSLAREAPFVVASVAGVAGDPGWGSPRRLLHLTPDERVALLTSRKRFLEAVSTRTCLWAAEAVTLTGSPLLRAGNIALDNRRCLPPFPPAGRNEDGVFGLILAATLPPGCIAHLPAAVLHRRPTGASFDEQFVEDVSLRIGDILGLVIADWTLAGPRTMDPAPGCAALGLHLERVGGLPLERFQEYLLWLRLQQAVAEIESLQDQLHESGGRPRFWARLLEERIRALESAIVDTCPVVASDCHSLDPARATQAYVRNYGLLLQAWPEIRRAASALIAEGITPHRTVTGPAVS